MLRIAIAVGRGCLSPARVWHNGGERSMFYCRPCAVSTHIHSTAATTTTTTDYSGAAVDGDTIIPSYFITFSGVLPVSPPLLNRPRRLRRRHHHQHRHCHRCRLCPHFCNCLPMVARETANESSQPSKGAGSLLFAFDPAVPPTPDPRVILALISLPPGPPSTAEKGSELPPLPSLPPLLPASS